MAVTWKKLAYESDVVLKSTFTAEGDILYATGPGTVAALAHGTDGQVLKVSSGVPAWADIGAPTEHKLNSHSAPDGSVDFNLQQATKLVVHTVANEAALPTTSISVGQLCWATGELTLHICTSAS